MVKIYQNKNMSSHIYFKYSSYCEKDLTYKENTWILKIKYASTNCSSNTMEVVPQN